MKKLFLSHAVKDKELVDAFIELLEGGVGIEKEAIFCTSSEGQGIPTGEDFNPFMRTELQQASIVVALVTENYYESAFCLCETGGAWYGEKPFIPLLSPPVNFGDLRGALYGKQAGLLNETRSLNEAYDRLRRFSGCKRSRGRPVERAT
jgi:TIR domain-containing protein